MQPFLHTGRYFLPLTAVRGRIIKSNAVIRCFIIHLADEFTQFNRKRLFSSPLNSLYIDDPALFFVLCFDDSFVFFIFPAVLEMCIRDRYSEERSPLK